MPFIAVSLSKAFTQKQAWKAKQAFGRDIALLPGKDESKLMLKLEHTPCMFFRGNALCNGAYVDCRLFGTQPAEAKFAFASAVYQSLTEVFDIQSEDVFLSFSHFGDWGSAGGYKTCDM